MLKSPTTIIRKSVSRPVIKSLLLSMLIPIIFIWLAFRPSTAINPGSNLPHGRTYLQILAGVILMTIVLVAFRFVPERLSNLDGQGLLKGRNRVVFVPVLLALLMILVFYNGSYVMGALTKLRPILQRVYIFTVLLYLLHIQLKGLKNPRFYEPLVISAVPLLLITGCYLILAAILKIEPSELSKLLSIVMIVTYFNLGATMLSGDRPLDNGIYLPDGNRLFGDGKSLRGTSGGLIIALVLGAITGLGLIIGLIVGIGTFLGDLTASFLKRRCGINRGCPVILLDQLDSIIYLLLLNRYSELFGLGINSILALLAGTMFVQLSGNLILFYIGKKDVPW